MKKLMSIVSLAIIAVLLVGCSALDPLSQFERLTSSEIVSVEGYNDIPESDIDQSEVEELNDINNQIVSLSTSNLELSNQEKIEYIKSLFQEIRETHQANVSLAESTKISLETLKSNIQIFRDNENELLPDDKETLIAYRDDIREKRDVVRETRGEVKALFDELRGNYKIENLDTITENLEEVLAILELRQEYIVYLNTVILEVDSMIIEYNS